MRVRLRGETDECSVSVVKVVGGELFSPSEMSVMVYSG